MNDEIVILAGARTPFGTFCGTLKNFSATDLAVAASKEAIKRSGVSSEEISQVIFGNAEQTGADAIYLARHVGLRSGVPIESPALNVNRICGSGFQAIISGAEQLLLGEAQFVLAGGAESMSQAPHIIRGARFGLPLGKAKMEDSLWEALNDPYCGCSMAITAENLAVKYGISRSEADEVALRSQENAKDAIQSCRLKEEIVPVEIKGKKGQAILFEKDEHPRLDTTPEALARLSPVFKQDGIVTAGNASGISDGGAALVLTTAKIAKERGLSPLGRLISWGIAGCPPEIMGIGPVPAAKQAFQRSGLTLDRMDLIEVNEAFAPQYLAVEKEMGLPREKVNVNGGAIALGHPLGATGARLTLTILYELRRRSKKYGLAGACIGGGQGIAVIVEAA